MCIEWYSSLSTLYVVDSKAVYSVNPITHINLTTLVYQLYVSDQLQHTAVSSAWTMVITVSIRGPL